MPNWCFNTISVFGPKEDVDKFLLEARGEDNQFFDFDRIISMPEGLKGTEFPNLKISEEKKKELKAKFDADNWYDWSMQNWGVKWNANCSDDWEGIESAKGALATISIETAGGPPNELLINASKKHKKLSFTNEFYECGMCFLGTASFEKGVITIRQPDWDSKEGVAMRKEFGIYQEDEE